MIPEAASRSASGIQTETALITGFLCLRRNRDTSFCQELSSANVRKKLHQLQHEKA
jgi:hypothetical protein